jgi:CRP-like cAMP-binding protein
MPIEAPTTSVAHLLALKAVPPFSTLPPDDLALLVARARPRALLANEVLVAEGKPLESVYLVLDGRFEEYRDGRPWAERAPYELIGGVDALARSGERVVVRATTPAEVLELGRDDLLDVCLDRFAVLETVAGGVATTAIGARRRLGSSAGFEPVLSDEASRRAEPTPDSAELVARLRAIPVFASVPVHTLAYCAADATALTLEPGRALWRAGDPSDHVVLVLDGAVECATQDGAQRFVLGPGEMAGALDAMAGVPRWHDASARTSVTGIRIARSAVLDVLEDDPETAVQALVGLARVTAVLVDRLAANTAPS